MRWSERQLAMLREMGIRVWAAPTPESAGDAIVVSERPTEPAIPAAATVARAAPTPRDEPAPAAVAAGTAELAGAEWLVVAESFDSAAADPAAAAEQELLLDNMLRAIRVARLGGEREGRACFLAVAAGRAANIDAAIATVRPRCILAFGRVAAAALLGVDAPLGKLREQVHERSGIPVVVTFALPYLLRHAADKPRAWTDLCRAVAAIA